MMIQENCNNAEKKDISYPTILTVEVFEQHVTLRVLPYIHQMHSVQTPSTRTQTMITPCIHCSEQIALNEFTDITNIRIPLGTYHRQIAQCVLCVLKEERLGQVLSLVIGNGEMRDYVHNIEYESNRIYMSNR